MTCWMYVICPGKEGGKNTIIVEKFYSQGEASKTGHQTLIERAVKL